MDEEKREKCIEEAWSKLSAFYINYILVLQKPEVHTDFPDYPNDFPKELLLDSSKKYSKPSSKPQKVVQPKTKSQPFEKVNNQVIGTTSSKINFRRRVNFHGNYGAEKVIETNDKADSKSVKSLSKQSTPQTTNFHKRIPLKAQKLRINVNKTLSDSSSSDEENKKSNGFLKTIISHDSHKRLHTELSETSSSEDEKSPASSTARNGLKFHANTSKSEFKTPNVPKEYLSKKESNISKLKLAFNSNGNFDDAMQMYVEMMKGKIKHKRIPLIIPAPMHDPMVQQSKNTKKQKQTKSKNSNINAHLGGIFTINNGWDSDLQQKKPLSMDSVQREATPTPPPDSPEHDLEPDSDLDDSNGLTNAVFSEDSDEEEFPEVDEPWNFETDYNDDAMLPIADSGVDEQYLHEDLPQDTAEEKCEREEAEIRSKHPKKIRKISSSDDEEEDTLVPLVQEKVIESVPVQEQVVESMDIDKYYEHDDAISLGNDLGSLDDLDDDMEIISELDDMKLKVKIQPKENEDKEKKKKEEPPLSEFDQNTLKILAAAVDLKTDKILKEIFGNVCPGFLENRCDVPACTRRHSFVDFASVRATLINASKQQVNETFQVVLRYHQLFLNYVLVFTEKFVNNNDTDSLSELVKGCDRHPRTKECLRDIVRKIIDLDHWKVHSAIRFIINHHVDSAIARDVILQMILDSGPCLPYFMDYIEFVYNQQSIHVKDFDRILQTCVSYQNPLLPNFCMNYMLQCAVDSMRQMNQNNLVGFLKMNNCASKFSVNLDAKLAAISSKLKEM